MIQMNSYVNPSFENECFRLHSQKKVYEIGLKNIALFSLKSEENMSIKPKTIMNMYSFNKFEVVLTDNDYICDISFCIDM